MLNSGARGHARPEGLRHHSPSRLAEGEADTRPFRPTDAAAGGRTLGDTDCGRPCRVTTASCLEQEVWSPRIRRRGGLPPAIRCHPRPRASRCSSTQKASGPFRGVSRTSGDRLHAHRAHVDDAWGVVPTLGIEPRTYRLQGGRSRRLRKFHEVSDPATSP